MSIRRIIVPLTGAVCDGFALAAAFSVARGQAALIDGIYMRPDPAEAVPYVGDAASAAIIEDIFQATKVAADSACDAARRALEMAAGAANIPVASAAKPAGLPAARFRDELGSPGRTVTRQARLADLVVTADVTRNPPILAAFEAALIGARRPVLMVPGNPLQAIGSRIAIAWNGSGEAAYALSCALPLLKTASSVTVLCSEPVRAEAPAPEGAIAYLALHGIAGTVALFDSKGKSVGAALIDQVTALGADLLVMGGYGHSRLREFILGGVTRHVMANTPVAVFMAH